MLLSRNEAGYYELRKERKLCCLGETSWGNHATLVAENKQNVDSPQRAMPSHEGVRGKHDLVFPWRHPEKSCPFFQPMGPWAVSLPWDDPAPSAKWLFCPSPIKEPPHTVGSSSNVTCVVANTVSRVHLCVPHSTRWWTSHSVVVQYTFYFSSFQVAPGDFGHAKFPVSCAYGEMSREHVTARWRRPSQCWDKLSVLHN